MGQRAARRLAVAAAVIFFAPAFAWADAYDPPANYYSSATGTGATLKSQLKRIIDAVDDPGISDLLHQSISYDALREALQVTDKDYDQSPGSKYILLIYNQESLNLANINPNGSIPGWDNGATWNREHTWPQSRGLNGTGSPDGSDLHHVRASRTSVNTAREETNFGGAFGTRPNGNLYGEFTNVQGTFWYPGDADAGWVARAQFYMAVRYDGTDSGTQDLELGNGAVTNVSGANDPPPQLGDLASMIDWHFAATPDLFERRRHQIVFDDYQNNRNPFVDHPEFVWSIFVGNTNDSRISIAGATVDGDGGSARNVDLGRVFVGGAVPAAQNFTLNKAGNYGTYFEVTTAGAATSSVSGRMNAFRTNQTDSKSITVGLNTSTATAGLRSGTVTVDNLDITTGGGAGRGANDANDLFNVSLAVLDHATPSFAGGIVTNELTYNFGSLAMGSTSPAFQFDVFNFATTPVYTAHMDFDSVMSIGDASKFATNLAAAAGTLTLGAGAGQGFMATLDTSAIGTFEATYTLMFSDEDLPGALTKSLTLTLLGEVAAALLAGDYNRDGVVDAADYTLWRNTLGDSVEAYEGADGDGDMTIGPGDYAVWKMHYGAVGSGTGGGGFASTGVPEPSTLLLVLLALPVIALRRRM